MMDDDYKVRMKVESVESSNSLIHESSMNTERINTIHNALLSDPNTRKIQIGQAGASAFPPPMPAFCSYIPLCLWESFKQVHIFYYIVCALLHFFQYCEFDGEVIHIAFDFGLIVVCIVLEMQARYATYLQNVVEPNTDLVKVWGTVAMGWAEIEVQNLRAGQLVMVMENSQTPAHIIPILSTASRKYVTVETSRIDKRELPLKVKILKCFRQLVRGRWRDPEQDINFIPQIWNGEIEYRFKSELGSTFEAELKFGEDYMAVPISNANTLTAGVQVLGGAMVGLVLLPDEYGQVRHKEKMFQVENRISQVLTKYLLYMVLLNLLYAAAIFLINLILTLATTQFRDNFFEYTYCTLISLASSLCNSVYIAVFLMIYVQRLIDSYYLGKEKDMNFRNRLKSLDELAHIDTLVMDDAFVRSRRIDHQGLTRVMNPQSPMQEQFALVVRLLDESKLLHEEMQGHVLPIIRYYKDHPQQLEGAPRGKWRILKQTLVDESTVEIKLGVTGGGGVDSFYILRFNERAVTSTSSKIKLHEVKDEVRELERRRDKERCLMLFIQIMEQREGGLERSNQFFTMYGALLFNQDFHGDSLRLVKEVEIQRRYNLLMMSSWSLKYIRYFMKKSTLSQDNSYLISLEEKEESEMRNILRNHIKNLEEHLSSGKQKKAIMLVSSSMVTHLSRANIRKDLKTLAKFCKYIVFYGCSEYEKQVCAVSIFRIFPNHVFFSNHSSDASTFAYSNFSLAERGSSAEPLATATMERFSDFTDIALVEAVRSIQIINGIIHTHTFKNQVLIIGNALLFLLTYRGHHGFIGVSYLTELFFVYNFACTSFPIVYVMIKRPTLYPRGHTKRYFGAKQMLHVNVYALLCGLVIGFMCYALLQEEYVINAFTVLLLECLFAANFFILAIDQSQSKMGIIVVIFVQVILAWMLTILVQLFNNQALQFIHMGTSFDPDLAWFFVASFLVIPLIVFMLLFIFAAGAEVNLNKTDQYQDGEETIQPPSEVIMRVEKSRGKQLNRFLYDQINQSF